MISTLTGHVDRITAHYSCHGKYIITIAGSKWDFDNSHKIWKSESGKLLYSLDPYNGATFYSVISPDEKQIINFIDREHYVEKKLYEVSVLDLASGKKIYKLEMNTNITSASYSSDSKFIITTCEDGTVKIWSSDSGKLICNLKDNSLLVTGIFFPEYKRVVTKNIKGELKLWNTSTQRVYRTLNASFLAIQPNGTDLAVTSKNNVVQIIDVLSGKTKHIFDPLNDEIYALNYSPLGLYIIADYGVKTRFWNSKSFELLYDLDKDQFVEPCFARSENYMALCSGQKICIYDAKKGQDIKCLYGNSEVVQTNYDTINKYFILKGNNGISVWDFALTKPKYCLNENEALISNNGKYLITASNNIETYPRNKDTVKIFELKSGKLLFKIPGHREPFVSYNPDYLITIDSLNKINIMETVSGKIKKSFSFKTYGTFGFFSTDIQQSTDGKYFSVSHWKRSLWSKTWWSKTGREKGGNFDREILTIIETATGKIFKEYKSKETLIIGNNLLNGYNDMEYAKFSPDWKYFVTMVDKSHRKSIKIRETETGTLKNRIYLDDLNNLNELEMRFLNEGKQILVVYCNSVKVFSFPDGIVLNAFNLSQDSSYCIDRSVSPNGHFIITKEPSISRNDSIIKLWDTQSSKMYYSSERYNNKESYSWKFSPDSKYAYNIFSDSTVEVIEIATGRTMSQINTKDLVYIFGNMNFSPDSKYFYYTTESSPGITICKNGSDRKIVEFTPVNKDWLAYIPDSNYYTCSKGITSEIILKIDSLQFDASQFDPIFNRPDKLLENIGLADTSLIKAYHIAYLKRLKKMRFSEDMFSSDIRTPDVKMINNDSLPITTNNPNIVLKIKATDSIYKLDRINVMINDVPAFGIVGVDLRPLNTFSVIKEIPLQLTQGNNKIQVSCYNEKGIESAKKTAWLTYQPTDTVFPNRYLIAISVSKYQDSLFNLKYAVKDGGDMAKMFSEKEFEIDTLFNKTATKENILALKQKLMQTKVDDEVILYVSGHGLLDKNFDFYFATYDMNFENPAEHGIMYDDLEGLLDGIPARKKLLLMDACHSGEVDKDEIETKNDTVTLADGKKGDIITYGYKGTTIINEESGLGLQNSFELMQELFANLTRGSGAVVISAAAGTGYALESAKWNNGVFTYCIINGLKEMAADGNKDKQVTVTELKDYVSIEVEKLTKGAQKPTSRRENLEFDWRVW